MADRAITVRDLERHIAQLEQYEQATSELIRVLQSDEKCEHVMSEKTRGAITSLKMNGLRNLLISYRAFSRRFAITPQLPKLSMVKRFRNCYKGVKYYGI